MKLRVPTLTVLLACTFALPAPAQNMKAGLWEVSSKSQTGDGQMELAMAELKRQMDSMPPEQRAIVQNMMAKQGASIDASGTGLTAKVCVTKEMAAQQQPPLQIKGDCKATQTKSSANAIAVQFTCTNPAMKGDASVSFTGDSSFNMSSKFVTTFAGKDQTMSTESRGKWLASDCGNIQPVQSLNFPKSQ